MGRGDLSRALLIGLAAAAAAASAAVAAVAVHWTVLKQGVTTQAGSSPVGYIAVTRAQERRFAARVGGVNAAPLSTVDLAKNGVIAVFLDGLPCTKDVAVNGVSRTGATVLVSLRFTRPPIGMATCVRIGTPYVLIKASRASLGTPAPTHVKVVAVARS